MRHHESGQGAVRHGAEGTCREFRHGFRPAKFVSGLSVLAAALLYGGDAGRAWHTPWWVAFPVVVGGFVVAGVVAAAHYGVRRQAVISASRENREAPASTSGSQPIR